MSSAQQLGTQPAWLTTLLKLLSSSGPAEARQAIEKLLFSYNGSTLDVVMAVLIGSTKVSLTGLQAAITQIPGDIQAALKTIFPAVAIGAAQNMTLMNITGWALYGAFSKSSREILQKTFPASSAVYEKCLKAFKGTSLTNLDVSKAKISDGSGKSTGKIQATSASAKEILAEKQEELDKELMRQVEENLAGYLRSEAIIAIAAGKQLEAESFDETVLMLSISNVSFTTTPTVDNVAAAYMTKSKAKSEPQVKVMKEKIASVLKQMGLMQ